MFIKSKSYHYYVLHFLHARMLHVIYGIACNPFPNCVTAIVT